MIIEVYDKLNQAEEGAKLLKLVLDSLNQIQDDQFKADVLRDRNLKN